MEGSGSVRERHELVARLLEIGDLDLGARLRATAEVLAGGRGILRNRVTTDGRDWLVVRENFPIRYPMPLEPAMGEWACNTL